MNALNQVIIEGNVVRTPERKETSTGKFVCTVPVAVNRIYKDSTGNDVNEVGYYDIEAWGEKLTSNVEKFCTKGRGVRVVGRLKQDRWENAEGKKTSKIYIVAEHIDFKPVYHKNTEKEQCPTSEENDLLQAAIGLSSEENY